MDEKTMCILALIFACIGVLIYLLYHVKKNGLRATVTHLIVQAEKAFDNGMNEAKMQYVVNAIRTFLPRPLRFFITYENVETFVQCVFDEIKEALDYKGG